MFSNILLFIYFTYLFVSSFPVMTYCTYRNISSLYSVAIDEGQPATVDMSDLSYLRAIQKRAGTNNEKEHNTPQKVSNETLTLTCIIGDHLNTIPQNWNSKAKHFLYLNRYIDNIPEVAVPPPRPA